MEGRGRTRFVSKYLRLSGHAWETAETLRKENRTHTRSAYLGMVRHEHEAFSFRLTQIPRGHVFGSYLARIGRDETKVCWFHGAPEDDAEHSREARMRR